MKSLSGASGAGPGTPSRGDGGLGALGETGPGRPEPVRHLGLLGATGVGVGAIVGGGILALAGVAFAATGPSAILAFALNGAIALVTACSFAELAVRFPQSGGTYAYARKVLTVEAAFATGWVVWFASVVAAVLYAMGFAVFLVPCLELGVRAVGGEPPAWLGGRFALVAYALGAVAFYAWRLSRSAAGGGQWATVGKVVVFAVLVAAGSWVLLGGLAEAPGDVAAQGLASRFRPFFAEGGVGLAQAMGYTFIALQGFDLIAAVGGEVRHPRRNVPRAMFFSLGTALAIYLPLLFLIVAVGSPDRPVAETAAANPEILVAVAARNFMGPAGYWLVVVAGLLSMLSALQANLLASSRFASAMASHRTLPERFGRLASGTGAPVAAVRLTSGVVALLIVAVPGVAAAGAVASLIFLTSFAATHWIAYLARRRTGSGKGFRTPWFPLAPAAGGGACLAIGLFQAVAVPSAGVLAALWLGAGAVLYALYLAPRARSVDASAEGRDPEMVKLRGRRPVVLVPIANPARAQALVTMAKAMAPPDVSRVRLLSVMGADGSRRLDAAARAQAVLGGALAAALEQDLRPEALVTVHDDPWAEIARVARTSRCEMVLLGMGRTDEPTVAGPLQRLVASVDADVVVLRAPGNWNPDRVRRILVPSRGGRAQSAVRARLLGSLGRTGDREVTFLGVVGEGTGTADQERTRRELMELAKDEVAGEARVEVVGASDAAVQVAFKAHDAGLVVMGLHGGAGKRGAFGQFVVRVAQATDCPLVVIGRRR